MSIAFETNNSGNDHRIERAGFARHKMNFVSSIYNAQDFAAAADRRVLGVEEVEEERNDSMSSSSTSSIGKNSDDEFSGGGGGGGGEEGEEVQSEYKEGPLDCLDALEEVLPVKNSMSKFYHGKSKSFTSLSDVASCSSMKDIVKPENAYNKKRRNLIAHKYWGDKNRSNILRSNSGGISKRSANSRSTLALAATIGCSESNNSEASTSSSSSPSSCLPPLPPHARRDSNNELSLSCSVEKISPWRSFSLSDLQGAAGSPSVTGLWINKRDK